MNRRTKLITLGIIVLLTSGCARIQETAKVIWGSSTRALEKARVNALAKTFSCSIDECFDTVVQLANVKKAQNFVEEEKEKANPGLLTEKQKENNPQKKNTFDIFIQNHKKYHLVVIGVAESIDTTEVGIFFTPMEAKTVKVEVSSLSSHAKQKIAEIVFGKLVEVYEEIQ